MASVCRHAGFFLLQALGAIATTHVYAADWYEAEQRSCELASLKPLPLLVPIQARLNGNGFGRFVAPKSILNQLASAPNRTVFDDRTLTSNELLALRVDLESLRGGPNFAQAALTISGTIVDLTLLAGTLAGKGLEWLQSNADAELRNSDRLLDMITTGGKAYYQLAYQSDPKNFKSYAALVTGYSVQVGNEPQPRKWLFSVCVLPIEVRIDGAETKAPGPNAGNKRLDKQSDGTFRQWDIDSGKYDSAIYRYVSQDPEFAYFDRAGDPWRIHLFGGPMQKKGSSGQWMTVYPAVNTY